MSGVFRYWQALALCLILIGLTGCPPPPQPSQRITPIYSNPVPAPEVVPIPVPVPAPVETVTPKPVPSVPIETPPVVEPAPPVRPPPPPPIPEPPQFASFSGWIPFQAWSEANAFGKPVVSPKFTYDLQTPSWSLSLTVGSRFARFNGLNLGLGFAPQLNNRQPIFHSLDAIKTFQPLLSPFKLPNGGGKVLMVDPGHGGDNLGAKCADRSTFEKELALDWGLRIARLLSTNGWTVHLTRTNDVEISLSDRVAMADQVKADLFISLHFNSVDHTPAGGEESGLETYCLTPVGMPSNLTRDYEDDQTRAYPNNAFDAENLQIAYRIHKEMLVLTGRKDRGIRHARFMSVLRDQNRPAVLLEGGFLTNRPECRLICTPEYRDRLARAVFRALCP